MLDTIFSPSFGNKPSKLVGRKETMGLLTNGLRTRPGSRERSIVILGQRGSGKTVLLWELADVAQRMDFVAATPTIVYEGMLSRIIEKVQDAGEQFVKENTKHIAGGSIGALGFSAGLQFTEAVQEAKSPQHKIVQLARKLNQSGKGLLILIDELQANSIDLKQLIITYQEMVGEGLDVAMVMAGLPGAVSATLNDKVLTFLNRATKINLGPLPKTDIDAFLDQSFKNLGICIAPELRKKATEAICGSPYLLQLIGHSVVTYANDDGTIDTQTFESAIETALSDFESDICKTSIAALSDQDVAFIEAVAKLGSPAKIGDVANVMGKTPDYAQKYRIRLIDSGVLESPSRGKVAIAIPYLESFLRKKD